MDEFKCKCHNVINLKEMIVDRNRKGEIFFTCPQCGMKYYKIRRVEKGDQYNRLQNGQLVRKNPRIRMSKKQRRKIKITGEVSMIKKYGKSILSGAIKIFRKLELFEQVMFRSRQSSFGNNEIKKK